ncbi:MAG: hypothetical protein U1F43_28610 [Myxococcota bacterium]
MARRRVALVAGSGAAAALAVGLAVALGGGATSGAGAARGPVTADAATGAESGKIAGDNDKIVACRFSPGQDLAFDFELAATIDIHADALGSGGDRVVARAGDAGDAGDAGVERVVSGATGVLAGRVLAVTSAGEAIVALRARGWRDTPEAMAAAAAAWSADLARPMLVRLDRRCRVLATARHRDTALLAYDRMLRLVDGLGFALPADGVARAGRSYDDEGRDTHGVYAVRSELAPADDAGGRGVVTRRRTGFVTVAAPTDGPKVAPRIVRSEGRVALGDGARTPWFSRLDDDEVVRGETRGRVAFEATTRLTARARAADPAAFAGADLALAHYLWGRPSEAELRAARDAIGPAEPAA